MKNEMIRALLAMTVFGTILLGLACGVSQNGNQSQNQNSNQNSGATPENDLGACKNTGSGKPGDIDKEIKNGMGQRLRDELIDSANPTKGSFKYSTIVRTYPGKPDFLDMYVEGTILGKDEFHEFAGLVRKAIKKDGSCVRNVYFGPVGSPIPALPAALSIVNPGWSYCEPPNRPCSDGSCDCMSPQPSPSVYTNSNANLDANRNVSNSNATNSATNNTNARQP